MLSHSLTDVCTCRLQWQQLRFRLGLGSREGQ